VLPDASSILATSTNPQNDGPRAGPFFFPRRGMQRAGVAVASTSAKVEAIQEPVRRRATPAEAAELRKIIALVFADELDRQEALALALGDPGAALESFRVLAKQARDWALWGPK